MVDQVAPSTPLREASPPDLVGVTRGMAWGVSRPAVGLEGA